MTCSAASASMNTGAQCAFTLSCRTGTTSMTIDGTCLENDQVLVAQCIVDGQQKDDWTEFSTCDCADPASIARLLVSPKCAQ